VFGLTLYRQGLIQGVRFYTVQTVRVAVSVWKCPLCFILQYYFRETPPPCLPPAFFQPREIALPNKFGAPCSAALCVSLWCVTISLMGHQIAETVTRANDWYRTVSKFVNLDVRDFEFSWSRGLIQLFRSSATSSDEWG